MRRLINPPGFVRDGSQYLAVTGSQAYGTNWPDSDFDVVGFCMPPKEMVFPHLAGEIEGFGRQKKRFEEWGTGENGAVWDADAQGGKGREYEFKVYSLVRFFQLCMNNNPNMLDVLFVPTECVLFSTKVGDMVRDQRRMFLHKGCWHKFKGYAFSQMKKMESKNSDPDSKRQANREKYGFDTKFAAHTLRLMYECEMILETGDLDLSFSRVVMCENNPNSHNQMRAAMSIAPAVDGALMPDAHVGYGLPIGGVLGLDNAVCPYAVGVDIACRMKMSIFQIDPRQLDIDKRGFIEALNRKTFFGVGVENNAKYDHPVLYHGAWDYIDVLRDNMATGKAIKQLGTSGSGNHFVEFGVLEVPYNLKGIEPGIYMALISHSGSRGTGAAVRSTYSDIAHNCAWKEQHNGCQRIVHRTGAAPAGPGVLGVFPRSMRTSA